MVWHYGHADMSFGSWQAAECQNHIEQALTSAYAIHALAKKRSIEVMPRNVNKGTVIRRVLEHHQGRGPHRRQSKRAQSIVQESSGMTDNMLNKRQSFSSSITTGADLEDDHAQMHDVHTEVIDNKDGETMESVATMVPTRERIDFIFCIGDDRADEYMFEYLRRLELHANKLTGSEPGTPFDELKYFASASTYFPPIGDIGGADSPGETGTTNAAATPIRNYTTEPQGADEMPLSPDQYPEEENVNGHMRYASTQTNESEGGAGSLSSSPVHFSLEMPGQQILGIYNQLLPYQQYVQHGQTTRRRRCIITATIGKKSSAAKWFMTGPQEVLALLEQLLECGKTLKGGRTTVPEGAHSLQSV